MGTLSHHDQLATITIGELGLSRDICEHLAVAQVATVADLRNCIIQSPHHTPPFIRRHICFFDRCVDEVIRNIETNHDFDSLQYHRHFASWSQLFASENDNVPASLYPDILQVMQDILSNEDIARNGQAELFSQNADQFWQMVLLNKENVHVQQTSVIKKGDSRDWQIFSKRYGIAGEESHTLEELGIHVHLTRERVRQLEEQLVAKITEFLFAKSTDVCREHGFATKPILWLREFARSLRAQQMIWSESALVDYFLSTLELTRTQETIRFVKCLLELMECIKVLAPYQVRTLRIEQLWTFYPPIQCTMSAAVITDIYQHLTTNYAQKFTFAELYARAQKMCEARDYDCVLTTELFQELIDQSDWIVDCGNVLYWIDSAFIMTRSNQLFRVFKEQQRPMYLEEIRRIVVGIKSKYLSQHVELYNLGNCISSDDRFVAVGRSGVWALQSMQIETATIQNLMVRCLEEYAEPQTAETIYAYVAARRPVSLSSITMYLSIDDALFSAETTTTWGLRRWVPPHVLQLRDQLSTYVLEYFQAVHKTQVVMQQIVLLLMMRYNLAFQEIHELLHQLPILRITSINGTKYVVLRQRWRKTPPRTNTIESRMHQRIIEVLQHAPQHEIAMSALITTLKPEFSCAVHTYYSYISRCQQVNKYITHDRVKMVKLVDTAVVA